VLVSMLLAPHGDKYGVDGFGPFLSRHGYTLNYSGTWIWYHGLRGKVMIDMLALEIVFLAVLFAVVVNIRWRLPQGKKPNPGVDSFKSAALAAASASPSPSSSDAPTARSKSRKHPVGASVLGFIVGVSLIIWGILGVWKSHDYRKWFPALLSRPVRSADNETSSRAADAAGPPFATAGGFARYAMKLREEQMDQIPTRDEPTTLRPRSWRYPWKPNIVTMVFWLGEKSHASVWDPNWVANYGGIDTPDPNARQNYIPTGFVPQQNPFYCALPYNDVANDEFKPEAQELIPWFKQSYTRPGESVCRHRWLAIRKGNRICYAEWEDSGPFGTDDFKYVFGYERPKPNANHGAGLSVSPAVRDYLGLAQTDVTDWQFVEVYDVPPGPWRNYGDNNHFVIARRQFEKMSSPKPEEQR